MMIDDEINTFLEEIEVKEDDDNSLKIQDGLLVGEDVNSDDLNFLYMYYNNVKKFRLLGEDEQKYTKNLSICLCF